MMEKKWITIDPDDIRISAYEIKAPEGYSAPEKFPRCCPYHESVFENLRKWFIEFPECCDSHRDLSENEWFRKESFCYAPTKVITQLAYTDYIIEQKHNADNWFEEIVFYIEHNQWSFGMPNVGFDKYMDGLKEYVEQKAKFLPDDKRQRLLEYIRTFYEPASEKNQSASFDDLFDTYDKWVEIFPFEVAYFSELKAHFEIQMPYVKGKPIVNPYNGWAKVKMLTIPELVERLRQWTITLLKGVNSAEMFQRGLIPDLKKHTLDLLNEDHRVSQTALLNEFNPDETKYVTLLEKWLAKEKEYFQGLTQLMIKPPSRESKSGVFSEYFNDESSYRKFMGVLIDKQICHPDSNKWLDSKKGSKGYLVAIVQQAHILNYYKEKTCPTDEQIVLIAKETFGVEISLDRVKKAKVSDYDVSFIPAN